MRNKFTALGRRHHTCNQEHGTGTQTPRDEEDEEDEESASSLSRLGCSPLLAARLERALRLGGTRALERPQLLVRVRVSVSALELGLGLGLGLGVGVGLVGSRTPRAPG